MGLARTLQQKLRISITSLSATKSFKTLTQNLKRRRKALKVRSAPESKIEHPQSERGGREREGEVRQGTVIKKIRTSGRVSLRGLRL